MLSLVGLINHFYLLTDIHVYFFPQVTLSKALSKYSVNIFLYIVILRILNVFMYQLLGKLETYKYV